jgi:hypothetical protein
VAHLKSLKKQKDDYDMMDEHEAHPSTMDYLHKKGGNIDHDQMWRAKEANAF